MDITVSKIKRIKIRPCEEISQERVLLNEKIEKKIRSLKNPSKRELDEVAAEQAKLGPLEQKATEILHRSLPIMDLNGAKFMIIPKYGNESKTYLNNDEVGLTTTICFTEMPSNQRMLDNIGEAIMALSEGGLLEVEITFKLKEELKEELKQTILM